METIRSFIAIELPLVVLQSLAKLREHLIQYTSPGVKWVDPKGIHLTIKFLGAVPANRLALIQEALAKVVEGVRPFSLKVKGIGVFPDLHRPRVAWVGLDGEVERLIQLQQTVDLALAPLGFAKENRPFVPHLTVARLREDMPIQERQRFSQYFIAAEPEPLPSFKIDYLALMKSQLTPKGAIYSQLGIYSFFKEAP